MNNHALLLAMACLLPTPATAQVNYAVSGNTAYVSNSPSASGSIVIASTYNGFPVTSIGDAAFLNCTNLTSVTIPNSVTSIGHAAFHDCTGLTSVMIPNSVTNIGDLALGNCTSLTNLTIGSSVASIGNYAFDDCTSLTTVMIPNSVTYIGNDAFSGCTSLTSVTIPNSVTSIAYNAFCHCTSLTNVTIPNSVTSIGDSAFRGCTSLASVTIPNSITSIGNYAFDSCNSLTSVTIPNSVTSIGSEAFDYCSSLTNISVGAANSVYSSLNGVLFNKAQTTLIQFPGGRGGSYAIPNSVPSIGGYAIYSCTSLTSVTIPNSITNIENWTFSYCTSLTNLTFLGNAPVLESAFVNVGQGAKVYYYYGTTGWGTTYGGLPTVMLGAPEPQVRTDSAGVKPGGFGFTLNGVTNQTIVVEASTNLVNWQPIWTSTLSTLSTNFVDPDWVNHPNRFYRLRSN